MRRIMNRQCSTQDIPCQRRKGASFQTMRGGQRFESELVAENNVTRKHALGTRAAMEQIAQAGKFIHLTYQLPAYSYCGPGSMRTYGIASVISFDATLSTPLESTLFTT
jgi:hypothetical protein